MSNKNVYYFGLTVTFFYRDLNKIDLLGYIDKLDSYLDKNVWNSILEELIFLFNYHKREEIPDYQLDRLIIAYFSRYTDSIYLLRKNKDVLSIFLKTLLKSCLNEIDTFFKNYSLFITNMVPTPIPF